MQIDLIKAYFRQRNLPVPQSPDEIRAVRYIDLGWVDSVGILEFVAFIEEKTRVSLSDADLMSEEFQTLGGVADILRRRIAAHSGK